MKSCETGLRFNRPCPRRLESLTICRYHYKGSTFSSVILKTLCVGPAAKGKKEQLERVPGKYHYIISSKGMFKVILCFIESAVEFYFNKRLNSNSPTLRSLGKVA